MATQLTIFDFLDTPHEKPQEPIKNLNSGIPYKGSKRKISHLILQEIRSHAPHAKYFYDMFGGGGAMALNAHYNGYTTHYNELDKDVYAYMDFLISQLQNKKGKYGILPDEWYRFITKAEFDKVKADTTPSAYRSFVLVNYSFGNDWNAYFCNAEKEVFKHKGHYLKLDNSKECAEWYDTYFKDKGSVVGVYQHLHDEIYPNLTWRERRPYFVDLTLKLEAIRVAEIAHLFQKQNNADTYKAVKDISQKDLCRLIDKHNPHLPKKNYKGTQGKGLIELKRLERLERLERLDLITHTNLDYAEVKINTPPQDTIIYCFDKETQIFTKDGWKYLSEIDIEKDMFFSRNPQTQELDFIKATHYINRHYSGKMWKHESKFIDLLVTPEHRIYSYNLKTRDKIGVFEFVEAKDFDKLSNAHFVSGGAKWNGEHIDFFRICGDYFNAIDFCYLLGVFITDGSINKQNAISIHQVKPHIRKKNRSCIKKAWHRL